MKDIDEQLIKLTQIDDNNVEKLESQLNECIDSLNYKKIKYLIKRGLNVNYKFKFKNNVMQENTLLEKILKTYYSCRFNDNSLMLKNYINFIKIIKLLFKNINPKILSSLPKDDISSNFWIIVYGTQDRDMIALKIITKLLAKNGADPHIYITPFISQEMYVVKKYLKMAKIYLKLGIKLDIKLYDNHPMFYKLKKLFHINNLYLNQINIKYYDLNLNKLIYEYL